MTKQIWFWILLESMAQRVQQSLIMRVEKGWKQHISLGLTLETQRDVLLLLVEEHLSRTILEAISKAAEFDSKPGIGIAFQIDVEDAVGVMHQVEKLTPIVEDEL